MLTGVKGNGKVVWELRGVFPPPRRRHFPTGGGCAHHIGKCSIISVNHNIHIEPI